MKQEDVVQRALRQLPYLEKAEAQLESDPAAVLRKVRPDAASGEESVGGLESMQGLEVLDPGVSLLQSGARAIRKLSSDGAQANLTQDERLGLEAVIHATGRPALIVQDNTFPDPPFGWEVLEEHRKSIEKTFPSVGAIDVLVDGSTFQMGTGFVVGKKILMTNRHVAKKFAKQSGDGWTFMAGRSARVDYRREKDRTARVEFAIKSIIGIHDQVDLALLELDTKPVSGKAKLPPPLKIAKAAPATSDHVYVVGYPLKDESGVTPSQVLLDIFGNDFGVKRLQPGEFDGTIDTATFSHDCSTLNGSSGSCVLSLDTSRVVGLHFKGTFEVRNEAVSLWALKDDPLLKGRVSFA